jgi:hypothetical protein
MFWLSMNTVLGPLVAVKLNNHTWAPIVIQEAGSVLIDLISSLFPGIGL